MKRNKIFDIIVSVIAACAIWAYVVSVQDPVTTGIIKSVPVQLTNTEVMADAGMAIAGTGKYTVDIVVSSNRSTINSMTADDFTATADVSQLIAVGQNYITVEVDAPATISVSEIRTQRIQVYVDKLVSVDKAVSMITTGLDEGYELGSVQISPQTVSVKGAESLVNTVVDVQTTIDVSEKNQDEIFSENCDLIPVDASGNKVLGVTVSQSKVNIAACKFVTKEVALSVPVEGTLNEHLAIRSSIIPASVTIKGPQGELDKIWTVYSEAIDISTVTSSCTIPLSFYLYGGVELADVSKDISVSYELKGRRDKAFNYSFDDITFTNIPEGLELTSEDSFELAFSLFDDEAESFAKENITLTVDLTDITEAGEYQLPVQLSVDEAYNDVVVTGLPETINVSLVIPTIAEETTEAAITEE